METTIAKEFKHVTSSPSSSKKGSRPSSGQKSSRPSSGHRSSRPQSAKSKSKSGSNNNSRPLSATSAKDRPTSAAPQNPTIISALKEIDRQIRKIIRQIKVLQREKMLKEFRAAAVAAANEKKEELSRPSTTKSKDNRPSDTDLVVDSTSVDPLLDLEDQKQKLITKYESMLPAGGKYELSAEALLYDFCDLFFAEFHQPSSERTFEYLLKYYDPQATLNIMGFKTFYGRENIVNVLLKRYEGLRIRYEIREVTTDPEPIRGSILSGMMKIWITIDDDTPRKVMQMFQFVKALESGPFDYVIAKEYFVVQDARPLYHFAEEPPPLSSLQIEYLRILEARRLQAEEEARRKELEETGSYDEEEDEESLAEGSRSVISGLPPDTGIGGEEKKDGPEVEEVVGNGEEKNIELEEQKSVTP